MKTPKKEKTPRKFKNEARKSKNQYEKILGGAGALPRKQLRARHKKKENPFKAQKESEHAQSHRVITKIDTAWFKSLFRREKVTQEMVSAAMGIPSYTMSLILNGKRNLQIGEAVMLSKILKEPLELVLDRAGTGGRGNLAAVTEEGILEVLGANPQTSIHLSGVVREGLYVDLKPVSLGGSVPGVILKGTSVKENEIRALRIESKSSKLRVLDGAIVYFAGLDGMDTGFDSNTGAGGLSGLDFKIGIPNAETGKLSIVRTESGELLLRVVEKAYLKGRFDLFDFAGNQTHEGVSVVQFSQVLWLKM